MNAFIWDIYKTLLPNGGSKIKMLLPQAFVGKQPYLSGPQVLLDGKHAKKRDKLTVLVGGDYKDDRISTIQKGLTAQGWKKTKCDPRSAREGRKWNRDFSNKILQGAGGHGTITV
jgi:hypothetical protein